MRQALTRKPIKWICALTALSPGAAHASGFYLQEQSVEAAGRAFSGEAANKGPEALWWNPAAIAGQQGGSAHVSVSTILPRGSVNDNQTVIVRPGQPPASVGGNRASKNPIGNGVLPSGAVAYGLTSTVAVGLSVTSPYSFSTNYAAHSWARYSADKTKLRTIDIQPTVAVQVTPQLSAGFALNIEHADATLSNALPNLSPLLSDGHQSLSGDGWDLGWSAGAQYHNGPLSVGASYKSSVRHKLSGAVETVGLVGPLAAQNGRIATQASFNTPWQAMASIRFTATPQLTLNAQVVRLGWSKFDTIDLGAPLNVSIPESYRDTWSFAGGLDYVLSPKFTVRAGVQHDQTPTHSGHRDARVPDSDRWNFAAGGSYALSSHFTLDAAAAYIAFKDAVIDRTTAAYAGTAAQTPIFVDGEVADTHALVFSLGGRMSF